MVRPIFVCGMEPLASGKPPRLKKELRRVRLPLAGFAVSAALVGDGIEPSSSGKPPRLKKELRRVRLPIAGFAMSAALVGVGIEPTPSGKPPRLKKELRRVRLPLAGFAMSAALSDVFFVVVVCVGMWLCWLQACHGLLQIQFQRVAL